MTGLAGVLMQSVVFTGVTRRWHAVTGLLAALLLFSAATTSPYGVGDVNPLALAGLVGWLLWLCGSWPTASSCSAASGVQQQQDHELGDQYL
ncbi:hypothetical protein AB0G04_19120 [Actinoplanes sp. NPDC023801]|uniref:hypothetical protein n=1 Tax=Actinoplanes sp. NPDC023801 TaxID=3154595 RepID=UPI0033CF27C3